MIPSEDLVPTYGAGQDTPFRLPNHGTECVWTDGLPFGTAVETRLVIDAEKFPCRHHGQEHFQVYWQVLIRPGRGILGWNLV